MIRFRCSHEGEDLAMELVSLREKPESLLSPFPNIGGHSGKAAVYKAGIESSLETNQVCILILNFWLSELLRQQILVV